MRREKGIRRNKKESKEYERRKERGRQEKEEQERGEETKKRRGGGYFINIEVNKRENAFRNSIIFIAQESKSQSDRLVHQFFSGF